MTKEIEELKNFFREFIRCSRCKFYNIVEGKQGRRCRVLCEECNEKNQLIPYEIKKDGNWKTIRDLVYERACCTECIWVHRKKQECDKCINIMHIIMQKYNSKICCLCSVG